MAKKIHQTLNRLGVRSSVIALASCLVLSGLPSLAQAAGLGKIVVFSALGQPLRAEIELSATREELSDMKAQLASPDSFKQAGIDYSSALQSLRFSLDKRANGQSVIRLSSDRPINDPFVDMLLELNWPAGRLVLFTTKAAGTLSDFRFEADDTLLFGKESAGAPEFVHAAADARVFIPIRPETRSLNLSVSAGIALWEGLRQVQAWP